MWPGEEETLAQKKKRVRLNTKTNWIQKYIFWHDMLQLHTKNLQIRIQDDSRFYTQRFLAIYVFIIYK